MAKTIEVKKAANRAASRPVVFTLPELHGNGWLFLKDFRFQAIAVALVAVLFYYNTYKNNYAVDDDIVMKQNTFVQKGISGIPEILFNDAYKSFYQSMGVEQQLSGGRYRPLSIVTFAIEQSLFGETYGERFTEVRDSLFQLQREGINNATTGRLITEKSELERLISRTNNEIDGIRHGMQVFWFVLALLAVLWFLREHIFRTNTDIAFLTVLLFAIHPIHTEVVANVKSRDEIFSLFFIALTLTYFFRYDITRDRKTLIWGMAWFFLAFLSKEYAATLLVLIPAGLMIFHKRKLSELVYLIAPVMGVVVFYVMVRLYSVGGAAAGPVNEEKQDVFNDPYLYANDQERIASKINRLDDYLFLLVFPYELAADYSFAHFPYSRFSDPMMWLSIAIYAGLFVLLVRLWQKRHPMAFALLIYFGFFAMISNIFFDIGATMGERLIFHSSLGFCMAVAWLLIKGVEKINAAPKVIVTGAFVLVSIPAFFKTVERNEEWRNGFTLFKADVQKHPNSAWCQGNAGSEYMNLGLYWLGRDTTINGKKVAQYGRDTVKVHRYADTARTYLLQATKIHKKYVNGWLNLGLTYYYTDDFENAAKAWGKASMYFYNNANLIAYQQMFVQRAQNRAAERDFAGAARFYRYASMARPTDPKAWADYGGSSFMAQDFATARYAFGEAVRIDRSLQKELEGGIYLAAKNDSALAAWRQDSLNPDNNLLLGARYLGTADFWPISKRLLKKTLELRPDDARAVKLLDSLSTLEKKAKLPPPAPKP